MTNVIAAAILQIFCLMGLGFLARRLGYLKEEDLSRWSRLGIDFLLPGLCFRTMTEHLDAQRLRELWSSPLIAIGIMVVGMAIGFLLRPRHSPVLGRTFVHICATNNYFFLPIAIIQRLWGDAALADFFIFNIGSTIGYWSFGVALLGEQRAPGAWRQILSPNLAVTILAVGLCIPGWNRHIPSVVSQLAASLGAASVPLLVILVGAGLYPLPKMRHKRLLAGTVFLRLVGIPACAILILHLLPLANDLRRVATVVALMPAAVTSVILTRRYGGDPDFAAECVVLSTLLSAVTMPFALAFLLGAF